MLWILQVELIVKPSDEVIPQLRSEHNLERLDFVFMDHWKKCYLPDLQVTRYIIRMVMHILSLGSGTKTTIVTPDKEPLALRQCFNEVYTALLL